MGINFYAHIFAGLGLFFVGINVLSDHLKSFGKPYVAGIIKTLAKNDLAAILSGVIAGTITNSGKAVTFSLTGFITAGMLTTRAALPIIIGGSLGSSFLVLWVSIDFAVLELFILGVAGILFQFGDMKSTRMKLLAGVLLGLGLIFYGLDMLKGGAAPLKDAPAFIAFVSDARGYWLTAFALGAIGAFITQSGSSLSIIVIAFVNAGLLDFDQSVMFVYGTNVGSGISTAMLSLGVAGTAKQMVIFHALVKLAGSMVLIPLLYVEVYLGVPLAKALAAKMAEGLGPQIGVIYLSYEFVSGMLLLVLMSAIIPVLNYFFPPTQEEKLSAIKYLRNFSTRSPELGTVHIKKELARIIKRAPRYLDMLRDEIAANQKIRETILYEANAAVQKEIQECIAALLKTNLNKRQTDQLLIQHTLAEASVTLDKKLLQFVKTIREHKKSILPDEFVYNLTESLHLMLFSVTECIQVESSFDARYLVIMTENRDRVVERLKQKYLLGSDDLSNTAARKKVIDLILCYEQILWTLNKIAKTFAADIGQSPSLAVA
ncbi:MAG: Na/Pi cotransporter family protein [Gammaproteobacteria bacterium]|nr:Na/Pi cotransporter family protein [Gammaproteobacteria bacterium]